MTDRVRQPNVLQRPNRSVVHRFLQRLAQSGFAVAKPREILWLPGPLEHATLFDYGRIVDDGCRRIAMLQRGRIDERLKCRAGLTRCLRRAIVVIQEVVETAHQGHDGTVLWIERDEGALHIRQLGETQPAVAEPPEPNYVTRRQHVC